MTLDELEVLKLKCAIVEKLMWVTERAVWGGERVYEQLTNIHDDLKTQYYSRSGMRRWYGE